MTFQCGELCGAFIDVGVFVVLIAVGAWCLLSGISDMRSALRKRSTQPTTDQKCPHCGTWQSERGAKRVGKSENPEIDFLIWCRACDIESAWVWIGPGICATYEEINKPKSTPSNFHGTSLRDGGYVPHSQRPPLRNPTAPPGDE